VALRGALNESDLVNNILQLLVFLVGFYCSYLLFVMGGFKSIKNNSFLIIENTSYIFFMAGSWARSKMVRQVHKTNPQNSRIFITLFRWPFAGKQKTRTQEVGMGLKKRRKNKPYINEVVLERVSRMRLKKKSLPLAPHFSISFAGQMSWTSVATRAIVPRPLGRPNCS